MKDIIKTVAHVWTTEDTVEEDEILENKQLEIEIAKSLWDSIYSQELLSLQVHRNSEYGFKERSTRIKKSVKLDKKREKHARETKALDQLLGEVKVDVDPGDESEDLGDPLPKLKKQTNSKNENMHASTKQNAPMEEEEDLLSDEYNEDDDEGDEGDEEDMDFIDDAPIEL
jgi:hypothetical protein